jgi:D-aminopeptidase
LTKAQVRRLAIMAQDGMARALRPVHTPLDGDIVFVGATGLHTLADPMFSLSELGALAADVVARAIARGVYEARPLSFPGALPCWRDKFTG